jgi:hypothetical protein
MLAEIRLAIMGAQNRNRHKTRAGEPGERGRAQPANADPTVIVQRVALSTRIEGWFEPDVRDVGRAAPTIKETAIGCQMLNLVVRETLPGPRGCRARSAAPNGWRSFFRSILAENRQPQFARSQPRLMRGFGQNRPTERKAQA